MKEQGDYNLKYLIAAALLDDQLGPAQLDETRIQAPDAQALLTRVEIRPDERFRARYPRELSAQVAIRIKDQTCLCAGAERLRGRPQKSNVWEWTVEKFHWLAEAFADEELRRRLIAAVERFDTSELSDLTDLLAQVRPTADFPLHTPAFSKSLRRLRCAPSLSVSAIIWQRPPAVPSSWPRCPSKDPSPRCGSNVPGRHRRTPAESRHRFRPPGDHGRLGAARRWFQTPDRILAEEMAATIATMVKPMLASASE